MTDAPITGTLRAIAAATPAPHLGDTTPIRSLGRYLGSITHLANTPQHVPVCAHPQCQRDLTARLEPQPTHRIATGRLLTHWDNTHGRPT